MRGLYRGRGLAGARAEPRALGIVTFVEQGLSRHSRELQVTT